MSPESDLPWREYSKTRLPAGFAHVLGRDTLEAVLREHGVLLDSLFFDAPGPTPTTRGSGIAMVFDFYWVGDGRTQIFAKSREVPRLLMRWNAVRSGERAAVAAEVTERWLPEACRWAAEARRAENVWRANDHRWMLVRSDKGLAVSIDAVGRR
ncbi:hypothetical protein [Nocardioides nitrophenolicus]|uniref:hypothetical protein n=1 Tax=Nocardioides nitrophenolicus TaxID=60489 RepID=UPI00195A7956|nr:hypothetical protein [Nocardioides nitrophenolicus]MBM7519377.1 hypothetical protein [Nocardioides nitrophenolicus]